MKPKFTELFKIKTEFDNNTNFFDFDLTHGLLIMLNPNMRKIFIYRLKKSEEKPSKSIKHGVELIQTINCNITGKISGIIMNVIGFTKDKISIRILVIDGIILKIFEVNIKDNEFLNENLEQNLEIKPRFIRKKSSEIQAKSPLKQKLKRKKIEISQSMPITLSENKKEDSKLEIKSQENKVPQEEEKTGTDEILMKYAKMYEAQSAKLDSVVFFSNMYIFIDELLLIINQRFTKIAYRLY